MRAAVAAGMAPPVAVVTYAGEAAAAAATFCWFWLFCPPRMLLALLLPTVLLLLLALAFSAAPAPSVRPIIACRTNKSNWRTAVTYAASEYATSVAVMPHTIEATRPATVARPTAASL